MNRVLVVESDATTRGQLEALIKKSGFEPIAVLDAGRAVETLESADPPRLVVLGWQMPGPDGLGLLRWLRSDPARSSTWVLMLTGDSGSEEEIAALDAGADDYLVKPVDAARLRAHLRAGARRATPFGERGDARGRAAA